MSALEIKFNCLCLFAPDPGAKTVHVLMPNTHGDHRHSITPHVVRIVHRDLPEKGIPMEKWALVLGGLPGTADPKLEPTPPPPDGEEIVDLTHLAGKPLDRRLIEDRVNPEVISRVTLRKGRVTRLKATAVWTLGRRDVFMAHDVTWRIDDLPHGPLTWLPLGASGPPPLTYLSELSPDADEVYRLSIYHVSEDALPPNTGSLSVDAVKAHFRAFYRLWGIANPGREKLPHRDGLPSFDYNCPTARGSLAPPPKAE